MFIEMTCSCTASVQVDMPEDKETMGLVLVNRFTNAHVSCGFMTELREEKPMTTKKFDIKTTEQDK